MRPQPATKLRFCFYRGYFYPTGRNPIRYIIFFNFNLYIRYAYTHGRTPKELRKKLRVAGCVFFQTKLSIPILILIQ